MTDASARFAVSVKGVLFMGGLVVLLRNERGEWELPGGRLEPGEDPRRCLEREIAEELSVAASAEAILDCWLYEVLPGREVVIVSYGCRSDARDLQLSHEHKAVGRFRLDELDTLAMPEGYRRSIRAWAKLTGAL